MTAYVTISCDGTFDEGRMPCRATLPVRAWQVTTARNDDLVDLHAARIVAFEHGWRTTTAGGGRDLCPAHVRAEELEMYRSVAAAEQVSPELAAQLQELAAGWPQP